MMVDTEEHLASIESTGYITGEWSRLMVELYQKENKERWYEVMMNDYGVLLDRHLPKIKSNGWTAKDIRGLIPLIKGRKIIAVNIADVIVFCPDRGRVKLCFRPSRIGSSTWQEGRGG